MHSGGLLRVSGCPRPRAALLFVSGCVHLATAACFAAHVAPRPPARQLRQFRTASRARDFQPAVHRMQSAASLATPPEALWADLAAIPTVAAGFIVRGAAQGAPPNVLLRRNQKDLSNNEARSHLLQFSPAPAQGGFAAQPFPTELRDVGAIMPSPCGQLLALVRSRTANGKKEQSIEIWNGDMLVASVKANAEQHGDIYAGDVFASFEWSPDSSALLYVAEAPAGKTASYWRDGSAPDKGVGKEFEYKDDWGELSTGKRVSRLFVLHVSSNAVKMVQGVPSDMAAGQAIWSADGTGIILTTFPVEPRRLGVRFYNTRKSRIAVVPAPTWLSPATVPPPQQGQASSASAAASNTSALRWLTPEDEWSARNPKLSPDGSKLIYVVSADSTAHFSASKLMCAPWPSAALTRMPLLDSATVLDIVPVAASPEEFPGLFLAAEQLPRRVWLGDSRHIVLHSDWRTRREVLVIDTEARGTDAIRRLRVPAPLDTGSWVLLDVCDKHILAAHSSPSRAPSAHMIELPGGSGGLFVEAVECSELRGGGAESKGAKLLQGVDWSLVPLQAADSKGMMASFDALLLEPAGAKDAALSKGGPKIPLIAYPHGGPHSNMGQEHYAACALLVLSGYSVMLCNYRGSTGYGQAMVDSLCGKVGRQDVDDMVLAVQQVLKTCSHLDASRVAACGGSHGGFLSLHLVGQFGDVFKAAAVRNPVTNIATMYGATDIPDWCYTETGSQVAYAQPTAEQYAKALTMSPMAHVSKITAPVLLLVGGDDRRVPPFQSKEFYYALKERGAAVEMLWYDGHTHGLAETPKGEGDGLVNICYFFEKHL